MTLKEYLEKENISVAEFARVAQVSRQTIYNAAYWGKGLTLLPVMERISKATKGKVKIQDLKGRKG